MCLELIPIRIGWIRIWIQIRQNGADPTRDLNPDPQHLLFGQLFLNQERYPTVPWRAMAAGIWFSRRWWCRRPLPSSPPPSPPDNRTI